MMSFFRSIRRFLFVLYHLGVVLALLLAQIYLDGQCKILIEGIILFLWGTYVVIDWIRELKKRKQK